MRDLNKFPGSAQDDVDFWKKFEGLLLDGQFPLDAYQAHSETGAVFLSRFPNQEKPALVKVVLHGTAGGQRLSAGWALAKQWQHPNLVRVYEHGTCSLDGLRVDYAVTDQPDAYLTSVLQERSLTEEEGREVLLSCSQALQYLHANGLVHTHVKAAGIVSLNETIQLSSDHLAKAADASAARSGDIRSLGATMVQVLTGQLPGPEEEALADLNTAYSGIIRSCLAPAPRRITARQIVNSLKHPAPERIVPAARREALPPQPRSTDTSMARYAIPLVVLLLLGSAWLVSRPARRPAPVKPVEQGDVDRSVDRSKETKPLAAPVLSPAPAAAVISEPPAPPPARPSAPNTGAQNWRVVVYTYSQAGAAEHKVAEINRKWPNLHAQVFVPRGGSSHLVVLGNEMNRDEASKLRRRALATKLPRDSYIQNF